MTGLLQSRLQHRFRRVALLELALTHSSYAHEHNTADNERLEFLGDAVLELAASALLYERFPDAREGQLSRLRSRLVNTDALEQIAVQLNIGPHLRLGVGEEQTGGRQRRTVLADAIEAILGAIYLDAGAATARKIATRWLERGLSQLDDSTVDLTWKDPRSLLQETVQKTRQITPTYRVVERSGPAHCPVFMVEVCAGSESIARGFGGSKRDACRDAAAKALENL